MRFGAIAENPVEWLIARLNVAPRPLIETQMAYTLARLIMVATKLGVFEVLTDGPARAEEVAARCETRVVRTDRTEAVDLVLIAQLVHHFSESQNRELAKRVAA